MSNGYHRKFIIYKRKKISIMHEHIIYKQINKRKHKKPDNPISNIKKSQNAYINEYICIKKIHICRYIYR